MQCRLRPLKQLLSPVVDAFGVLATDQSIPLSLQTMITILCIIAGQQGIALVFFMKRVCYITIWTIVIRDDPAE